MAHENNSEVCVCAPQWIASGGGCMCWPMSNDGEES